MIRYRVGKPYYPKRAEGERRPRRCYVCAVDATHVEEADRPGCVIKRDGTRTRFVITEGTFYCSKHGSASPKDPT